MRFVQVRSYDNYVNANMQLGLLREAGIECHIRDEYTITIDPLLSPALGGMKLMVEEGSVTEAMKLLEDSDRLFLKSVPCPRCNEYSLEMIVETTRFDTWAGRLKSMIMNGQEQEIKKFYRCKSCSYEYADLTLPV